MAEQRKANRLINESSPYLLQHARNPVDWYPWGEDAWAAAREQGKPIFLSIGYATCHWCHVMEHESFDSESLATLMNETFINVKVDREELPQVDSLYMEFAQMMLGGSGGWPLNLVLTSDLRPLFAATYLPPDGQGGQLGLRQLVLRIRELWQREDRTLLLEQAEQIFESLTSQPKIEAARLLEEDLLQLVIDLYYRLADPVYGGLQGAPKFPMSYQLDFLLRHAFLQAESRSLFYVQTTLEMMYRGGIYDHIGGGFARYSVDSLWMIPHFEKMLYDNAILASSYCEAWQMTKVALYRAVAEDIFRYLLRDMTTSDGAFCSAEDADSDGREGYFYTWTVDEILSILGPNEGALFCQFYGVSPEGNFEGRNVLYIPQRLEEFASEKEISGLELGDRIAEGRRRLWEAREQRNHPAKDDKVLTAWNGLMIRSLAEAGVAFKAPRYITAAQRAARFLQENLWDGEHLYRRWRGGQAGVLACLEDYAYLIAALLSLFKADGDSNWLAWAVQLTQITSQLFKSEEGDYYRADESDPHLLMRQKELYDGAEPSGNAVHCENLLRLYQLSGAEQYRADAEQELQVARGFLEQHPVGGAYHCLAMQRYLDERAPTVVIALNLSEDYSEEIREALADRYLPHAEIIWRKEGDKTLFHLLPGIQSQGPVDGQTTLYVCREGVCEAPISQIDEILNIIREL